MTPDTASRLRPVALPGAVAFALFVAAVVPGSEGGSWPDLAGVSLDLWLHAVGYGALAGSVCRALSRTGRWAGAPTVAAGVAVAVAVGYGAGTELLQTAVPGRTASLADLAADAVGALVAAGGWWATDRNTAIH